MAWISCNFKDPLPTNKRSSQFQNPHQCWSGGKMLVCSLLQREEEGYVYSLNNIITTWQSMGTNKESPRTRAASAQLMIQAQAPSKPALM